MSKRKVVVTGLGPVTPNGIGKEEFWDNIVNGRSFFETIPWAEKRGYGTIQQNKIKNFDFKEYFADGVKTGKYHRKTVGQTAQDDSVIKFGVLATKLALDDSGLEYNRETNNIGIFIGNANGAIETREAITKRVIQTIMEKSFGNMELIINETLEKNKTRKHISLLLAAKKELERFKPLFKEENLEEFLDEIHHYCGALYKFTPPSVMNSINYAIPAKIACMFGFHGESGTINTACSASLDAIGVGYRSIKDGLADIVIAGGSEAPITEQAVSAFDKVGVISKTKPRPFCIERDGFVMAEGAAALVLEEEEHALKRGANIYGEIKGFGRTIDGTGHMCSINPEGVYLGEAISFALEESGLKKSEIDYVNLHGTATKTCDVVETKVLKCIFGSHAYRFNTGSTKSMTGHAIAATGAMEAIIALKTINEGVIPPTININRLDPNCDLDYTPNEAVEKPVNNSLVISMGFGGYNTGVIFSKYIEK